MGIILPTWYSTPWAGSQNLTLLTRANMAMGFPSGIAQRPTRQDLNRAIEFAVNGVLYYLSHGIPEWLPEAQYPQASVVSHSGRHYRANVLSIDVEPGTNGATWEALLWRISELDEFFLRLAEGDATYLSAVLGDQRFYPRSLMAETFITPAQMASIYAPVSALTPLLRRDFGTVIFLTQAVAEGRYASLSDSTHIDDLAELLAPLLTRLDASERFFTEISGAQRWVNEEASRRVFLTTQQAQETLQRKEDAAISVYSPTKSYRAGVLVLDQGSFYRSQADNNLGNALTDTAWWRPWSVPVNREQDGRMLNYMAWYESGTYTLNAWDVPLLTEGAESVLMKFFIKGGGGADQSGTLSGGGEGVTLDVVTRLKLSDFPLTIDIRPNGDHYTYVNAPGPENLFGLAPGIAVGGDGSPGAGGNAVPYINPRLPILRQRAIYGAAGKWGIPVIRWGDGGGVHGSGGMTVENPVPSIARYGCGAGGGLPSPQYGGDGFVEIYWPPA